MSYDLLGWPVDRALSTEEAIAEIQDRAGGWPIGLGRDRKLNGFVKAMERHFRGLGTATSEAPMEFDVHHNWVFIALPWSQVERLVDEIGEIAFAEGVALFDPQRERVALPRPFGDTPLGTAGTDAHVRMAERAIDLVARGVAMPGDDPFARVNELARGEGFTAMSPLGFELTPDIEAEAMANPLRVPTSLQTAELREDLI